MIDDGMAEGILLLNIEDSWLGDMASVCSVCKCELEVSKDALISQASCQRDHRAFRGVA